MQSGKTGWGLLLACSFALALVQLWLRPLLPVDETRYLSVAWEMWRRGDFLVPYLNGEPYSHKPPLLFWMIHGLWALFGVSELAARLIPACISLVALWLSAALADRLWPEQGAAVKALVPWLLFGGLFWNNFFTLVQFDLLLVMAALLAWHGVLDALQRPLRGWSLAGVAIGLGVLSKGPVILVPVLPAILFAFWWAKDSRPASWSAWYLGAALALALGAALALAWAIPAGLAGGESYQRAIFWGQSAGRIVTSFAHRGAWWSYVVWLPLMWLPWVIWPALWKAARRMQSWDQGMRFCVAVILPALLVFSAISGKQGKYLLPLFPLIGLLLARALVAGDGYARCYRLRSVATLLALAGLVLLALPWIPTAADWFGQVQLTWGLALLLWGGLLFRLRTRLAAAVRAGALAMLLATAIVYLALLPSMRPAYELQTMSRLLSELQASGRSLAYLGKYHGQFHFLGRLEERIQPLVEKGQLQGWLETNPGGYLLVNYKTRQPDIPDSLVIQAYRGGSLVLWPAARLLQHPDWLDALPGSA